MWEQQLQVGVSNLIPPPVVLSIPQNCFSRGKRTIDVAAGPCIGFINSAEQSPEQARRHGAVVPSMWLQVMTSDLIPPHILSILQSGLARGASVVWEQ